MKKSEGKVKPVLAWAVVCRKDRPYLDPNGLPVIFSMKPTQFDKRFYRCVRVEIREISEEKGR